MSQYRLTDILKKKKIYTIYGETEEELLKNAKEHGFKVHGYTEETWNEEISKNLEHIRKIVKKP